MANRAAEEEMAEISLEQTVLIEQMKQQQRQQTAPEPKKKQAVKAGEKTKAPVSLNIAAMLEAFEVSNFNLKPGLKFNSCFPVNVRDLW